MPTILVVEGEFFIREFLCEEVAAAGYSVLEAPNADAALIALEGHQDIHLIFTDIDMPETLDGLQLAAVVRRRWPPMKIVIASGKRTPRAEDAKRYSGRYIPLTRCNERSRG